MNIHPSHKIERVDAVGDTCDNVVGSDQPTLCGQLATVAVPTRFSARGHFCADCAGSTIAALYEAAEKVRVAIDSAC